MSRVKELESIVFEGGLLKGKKLTDFTLRRLDSYLGYLEGLKRQRPKGVKFSKGVNEAYKCVKEYLGIDQIQRELERELGND